MKGTLSATNASGEDGAVLAAASVSPVKADGALGVLKFTALSDGTPSFRLTDTVFAGSDAKEVDVTVASGSTSQPDKSGETGDKTFTDTDGSFAEDAIEEAADLGLILGYEGKYRPADAMTRGECVTILYRAMGSPKVEKAATFTDLTHNYYRDAIAWAEQNGVVNGVGNGKFNPGGSVTRAQLATILYRMAGSPSVSGSSDFTDVVAGKWFAKAVAWAAANGIVNGYGDSLFGPNDPVTREQLAAILYRYAVYGGMTAVTLEENLGSFADTAQLSAYAIQAMNWAVGQGLINGSGSNLVPKAQATRAQVAAIIHRYLER